MSGIFLIILNLIGALLALFFFWRKLKDDYIGNQIFSIWFLALIDFIFFYFLAKLFFPKLIFWAPFLTSFALLLLTSKKNGMRTYESLEAAVISYLTWFLFFSVGLLYSLRNLQALVLALTNLVAVVGFFVTDAHYKKITWYKSGRTGFTGLFIMGLFFLARAAIGLAAPDMLIFLLEYDVFISGVISFISFLMIFNLART
jgi:hypothetical protein